MRSRLQTLGLVFAVLMPLSTHADDNVPAPALLGEFHVGLHGPDIGLYAAIPLTAVQQARTQDIMGHYQQQARPLASQLRSAEDQLRRLMLAPGTLDVTNVLALEQQVTQINAKLDDMALDTLAQVRSHLTDAQLRAAEGEYQQRMATWRQEALSSVGK
jgi:Spy/CpxP family protein refolding chaperone